MKLLMIFILCLSLPMANAATREFKINEVGFYGEGSPANWEDQWKVDYKKFKEKFSLIADEKLKDLGFSSKDVSFKQDCWFHFDRWIDGKPANVYCDVYVTSQNDSLAFESMDKTFKGLKCDSESVSDYIQKFPTALITSLYDRSSLFGRHKCKVEGLYGVKL